MSIVLQGTLYSRALALPENLTVKQCSEHLGVDLVRTRKLLKSIHYVARDLRKEHMTESKKKKQWATDWNAVDWTKKDSVIAKETGVSRWTVAKRRRAMT